MMPVCFMHGAGRALRHGITVVENTQSMMRDDEATLSRDMLDELKSTETDARKMACGLLSTLNEGQVRDLPQSPATPAFADLL